MLTLVTTTNNRPLCFSLLCKWIERQTYQPDQWLVINDSPDPSGYEYLPSQTVIQRKPKKKCKRAPDGKYLAGQYEEEDLPSICLNWLEALPHIQGDKIIVAEDDDWYHPTFLETMAGLLDEVDLAGVSDSIYYKLPHRRFKRCHNKEHASLGATAFRSGVLSHLERCCKVFRSVFIDMYLWADRQEHYPQTRRLIPNRAADGRLLHLGLKCMPGAAGLGNGHTLDGSTDPVFACLREFIGQDAKVYADLAEEHWPTARKRLARV